MVWFWAMVVSLALWHIAQNKVFRNAQGRITKSCALAYSEKIVTDFHCMAPFFSIQRLTACCQIRRSGPNHRRTLRVKYLGEFKSIFKTALNHGSAVHFGGYHFGQKISHYSLIQQ
jgi:hypothetical protein